MPVLLRSQLPNETLLQIFKYFLDPLPDIECLIHKCDGNLDSLELVLESIVITGTPRAIGADKHIHIDRLPHVLCAVNQQWRNVALGHSSFWNFVHSSMCMEELQHVLAHARTGSAIAVYLTRDPKPIFKLLESYYIRIRSMFLSSQVLFLQSSPHPLEQCLKLLSSGTLGDLVLGLDYSDIADAVTLLLGKPWQKQVLSQHFWALICHRYPSTRPRPPTLLNGKNLTLLSIQEHGDGGRLRKLPEVITIPTLQSLFIRVMNLPPTGSVAFRDVIPCIQATGLTKVSICCEKAHRNNFLLAVQRIISNSGSLSITSLNMTLFWYNSWEVEPSPDDTLPSFFNSFPEQLDHLEVTHNLLSYILHAKQHLSGWPKVEKLVVRSHGFGYPPYQMLENAAQDHMDGAFPLDSENVSEINSMRHAYVELEVSRCALNAMPTRGIASSLLVELHPDIHDEQADPMDEWAEGVDKESVIADRKSWLVKMAALGVNFQVETR